MVDAVAVVAQPRVKGGGVRIGGGEGAPRFVHVCSVATILTRMPDPRRQHSVNTAESSHLTGCVTALAAAFTDDPLMTYIWPDQHIRRTALRAWFRISLRGQHLPRGAVNFTTAADGTVASVAAWDRPGRSQQPLWATVRYAPPLVRTLRGRILAGIRVRRTLEAHHPRAPHWYLANIGTTPGMEGQGHASALIDHQLAVCDANRIPAYLVSTRESNVPFYQQFGFTVTDQFALTDGTPLWGMWRPMDESGQRIAD